MNMFRFMQSLECTVLVPLRITEVVIRLVCRLPNQVSKRSSSLRVFFYLVRFTRRFLHRL